MNRKQTIAEAVEKYRNCEMSPADIAEKYNVSSTVLRHHVSAEERMNGKRAEVDKLIDNYDHTIYEISKMFYFSIRVFNDHLRARGVNTKRHYQRVSRLRNNGWSSAHKAKMRKKWENDKEVRKKQPRKEVTVNELSAVEKLAMCGVWI